VKKEFLEDYAKKESESFERFIKNNQNAENFNQFPANDRFSKLESPVMYFDPFSYNNYGERIWSQIPFAGTLVVSLRNIGEKLSLQYQGFDKNDIHQLIELSKDTGRVQFGLQGNPLEYQNLDYLDEIFTELKPPTFYALPYEFFTDQSNIQKWSENFDWIGSAVYFNELEKMNALAGSEYGSSIYQQHKGVYLELKMLGWEKEIEELEILMSADPHAAAKLFEKYAILTGSNFAAFTKNSNWGLKELSRYNITSKNISNVFHPEIGTKILKKAALNPSDYHECRSVIDLYDQNQLYSVYSSLYRSMQNQHYGDITKHSNEVEEIMDNAWEDGKKLVGRKRTISVGLDVMVGAVGFGITEMLSNSFAGLFSSLGFRVLDNYTPWTHNISEKLMKKIQPNYLVNIYDFHKETEKRKKSG